MVVKIKGKALLVLATGAGVIVTAILAARKAPEAQAKKEAALLEKRERTGDPNVQLTWVESLQAQIGCYIPAITAGVMTLGSLAGSEVLNEQNLREAERKFNEFKGMTDRIDGTGAVKSIEKAVEQKKLDDKCGKPWDRKGYYRIVFQGHSIQFEDTRANVMEAFYEINRYFHDHGMITFNEALHFFGQNSVEEGNERGWESYVGETVYGYSWIDFGLKECENEPWVTEIYMPVYPHFFDDRECLAEVEEGPGKLTSNTDDHPRED